MLLGTIYDNDLSVRTAVWFFIVMDGVERLTGVE